MDFKCKSNPFKNIAKQNNSPMNLSYISSIYFFLEFVSKNY